MAFFCKITKLPRFSIQNSQDFQCKTLRIFNIKLPGFSIFAYFIHRLFPVIDGLETSVLRHMAAGRLGLKLFFYYH